jgi:hypothetical protein
MKVLQGKVRLQGFMSSPTPETHVRDIACAFATAERVRMKRAHVSALTVVDRVLIGFLLLEGCELWWAGERRALRGRAGGTDFYL